MWKMRLLYSTILLTAASAFVPLKNSHPPLVVPLRVSELDKVAPDVRELISKETKVCVITGASQGLGQAMAYELVSRKNKPI